MGNVEFVFIDKDDKYMYFEVFYGGVAIGTVYLKYIKPKHDPPLQPNPYQSMINEQEAEDNE